MASLASVNNDRMRDLKAFDDTKAGVKGLADSGIKSVPEIFVRPHEELEQEKNLKQFQATDSMNVPVIDLKEPRELVVNKIRDASKTLGIFMLTTHGIPETVMDRVMDGTVLFHEQDAELKRKLYSRDMTKEVGFMSNYDLYKSIHASWRDSLFFRGCSSSSDLSGVEGLPARTGEAVVDYMCHVKKIGLILFELLSEALGLESDRLTSIGCSDGFDLVCHYYPPCPEPELTLGATRHTDGGTLTLLLQSQLSAFQILDEGRWYTVDPIPGALIINIGDLLQVISNDRFKSAVHRVVANSTGPRISVACFYRGFGAMEPPKYYSPLMECTSTDEPPKYREILISDYVSKFYAGRLDKTTIKYYRI